MISKFYLSHGFPQCLRAVDGSHVNIKKPMTNTNDYMHRKSHYSFNVQAAGDYQYCFFNVVIKWLRSVHNARIFSNPGLNETLEMNIFLAALNLWLNVKIQCLLVF